MEFKALLNQYGISQSEFARRFEVPLRTVQNWCSDRPACKGWLMGMVKHSLETGYKNE